MKILKLGFRMAMAIPVLPASGGVLKNRRNSNANVCAPADVAFNTSDWLHSWINRVPGDDRSAIVRDRNGYTSGSISRLP